MEVYRKTRSFRMAICLFLSVIVAEQVDAQPDFAREQRLEAEIIDTILDGEAVKLSRKQGHFLGIYTESAQNTARGAVLVLHGRGFHPDWVDVVNPLRVGLSERGWNTLSLQMPVLAKGSTYHDYLSVFPEAVPRIQAGIEYLQQHGADKVILVAHSCSVHMSMEWFREHADSAIDGYVGIGMGATDYRQPMERVFPLGSFKVPVLDLYGAEDYPAVHRYAAQRLAAIESAEHPLSRQKMIKGANHYFSGADDVLIEAVSTWLDEIVPVN